jgi:hypothetical protein
MEKCSVDSETGKSDLSEVQGACHPRQRMRRPRLVPGRCSRGSFHREQNQYLYLGGGDSLLQIAERFYGDANAWNACMEADFRGEPQPVTAPDRIESGPILKIPVRS